MARVRVRVLEKQMLGFWDLKKVARDDGRGVRD